MVLPPNRVGMSLHAVDELTDAIDVTREFLTPVEPRTWLKLALVVFFVGGGAGFPSYAFNFAQPGGGTGGDFGGGLDGTELLLVVAAIVAAVLALFVALGIVGAIMEFVFVESLVSGDVSIREYVRTYWRPGLRLFGFRVAVALPIVLVVLAMVAAFVLPFLVGGGVGAGFLLLLLALPFVFLLAFLAGLVNAFATVFVVPVMLADDCGVLDGWRRLWPSLTDEPVEYIGYAVINYVIRFVTGTGATMVLGVAAIVLLLPFGTVGLFLLVVLPSGGLLAILTLVVLAAGYLLVLLAIWAVVLVPVESYHRYHALLVLGDIAPAYDLVADRRPEDDEPDDGFDDDGPGGAADRFDPDDGAAGPV